MDPLRHRTAAWIFGPAFALFLMGAVLFTEDRQAPWKLRLIGLFAALLAGCFGYFLTGSVSLGRDAGDARRPVALRATGGVALFVLVFLGWTELGPEGRRSGADGPKSPSSVHDSAPGIREPGPPSPTSGPPR